METTVKLAPFVFAAALVGLPSVASAQFEIHDPANVVQHGIIGDVMKEIVSVSTDITASLRRMARSLSLFEDLSQYQSPDQPLWRTRRITAQTTQHEDFMEAINAGGPIDSAMVLRLEPDPEHDIPAEVLASLATQDMAESALQRAVTATGKIRGNRREMVRALEAQAKHLNTPGSATAVLEKISGSGLMRAHQMRTRFQLSSSVVELQMVENKRDRDAENMAVKRRVAAMQPQGNMFDGADEAIAGWRQP